MTKGIFHYRVEIPGDMSIEEARAWCVKHCVGNVKLKYPRKYSTKKKRHVRDYKSRPKLKFTEEGDAMHFKLRWI